MSSGERVGVIGLGNIGGAVAANLVADGHHVSVFDLDQNRVQSLVGAGARAASARAPEAPHPTSSTTVALAIPPPSHMVCSP